MSDCFVAGPPEKMVVISDLQHESAFSLDLFMSATNGYLQVTDSRLIIINLSLFYWDLG